jgi:hypothetical protein
MRTPHNVESPGHETLGHSSGIYSCSKDIQKALKEKPTKSNLLSHAVKAKEDNPMDNGKNGRQAHPNKHGSPKGSPSGCAESGKSGDNNTAHPNSTNHGPVPVLKIGDTVKAVEDTGYKASHDESHNPDIVERVSDACNHRRMIRYSVISCRHAKAEGSPGEETGKSEDIRFGCVPVSRTKQMIESVCCRSSNHRWQEVGVDVDRLIVKVTQ